MYSVNALFILFCPFPGILSIQCNKSSSRRPQTKTAEDDDDDDDWEDRINNDRATRLQIQSKKMMNVTATKR